jgi:hypothetical protein
VIRKENGLLTGKKFEEYHLGFFRIVGIVFVIGNSMDFGFWNGISIGDRGRMLGYRNGF